MNTDLNSDPCMKPVFICGYFSQTQPLLIAGFARSSIWPVARIIPLARSRDEDEELLALASQGKLRLGEGVLEDSFWEMPAPHVSAVALRRAVE